MLLDLNNNKHLNIPVIKDLRKKYNKNNQYNECFGYNDKFIAISFIERYLKDEDIIKNKLMGLNNTGFYSEIKMNVANKNYDFKQMISIDLHLDGIIKPELINNIGDVTFFSRDIDVIIRKMNVVLERISKFILTKKDIKKYIIDNYAELNTDLIYHNITSTTKEEVINTSNISEIINGFLIKNEFSFAKIFIDIVNKTIFYR